MILVDTSVWIEHLRKGNERLAALLNSAQAVMHPFVIGELACGNLQNRSNLLRLFGDLPQARTATHDEVLYFIEQQALMGNGIGFIDAHLLASVALDRNIRLWTRDKQLYNIAKELKLAWLVA